jgi:hypothetical protein
MLNPALTFVAVLLAVVVPLFCLLYRAMVFLKSGIWPSVTAGTVGLAAADWFPCDAGLPWSRICAWLWELPVEVFSLLLAATLVVLARILVSAWQRLSV